ncbi:unnamed protein product [Peniophora sp. CBMAI 1063]|nr:unnamed protein product [Peniophora sp. CBMAI 1063]
MVLRTHRAPPTNPATIQVRTSSGRWLVLDARRLTNDRFELILPEDVLDALSSPATSAATAATSPTRSTTPLPPYSPPPPSYAASWNDALSHPAPSVSTTPAQRAYNIPATAAPAPGYPSFTFQAAAASTHTGFTFYPTPQPDPRPDIKEVTYKMPRAERIYCFFSKGPVALNNAPPLDAFPSPPMNGDTYVHHPTASQFAHQLWYYWAEQWVRSRTLAPHPAGRDYVLHWCPSSLTTRWMKRGSCKKDRVPLR